MMLPMRASGVVRAGRSGRGLQMSPGCLVAHTLVFSLLVLFTFGCGQRASTGGPLATLAVIGETGKLPGQFGVPRCIDNDGKTLWVVDRLARVQQFDVSTGKPLQEWRTPKYDRGKPTGITIWKGPGTPTLLCIADTHEARILMYAVADAQGNRTPANEHGRPPLLATFGAFGEDLGLFIYPTDVAIVSSADGKAIERVYVGEYGGNDRVTIWEPVAGPWEPKLTEARLAPDQPQFEALRSFGSFGPGPQEFNRPQSLAIWAGLDAKLRTSDDELIITDACNHRLGRFTMEGELKQWYGSGEGSSDAPGGLSYPYGLALLSDGTALVTEFGNNRLQRIDLATGNCLGLYGVGGRAKGQLVTPWGISVMGDTAWVLDTGNARVQSFRVPTGREVVTAATLEKRGGTR